jgi:hypothetical protein
MQTIEISHETANVIRRARIVEILTWPTRCAVLDAPSPDHPGPLGIEIRRGMRGFDVGREIAYTLAPATIKHIGLDGTVSRAPVYGKTDVHVIMAGDEPAV